MGCESEAPYFFEPTKETSEAVEDIARKLEDEVDALNNTEITFEVFETKRQFTMQVDVEWCQGDGSLWDNITGCKAAYCHICPITEGQIFVLISA